MKCRFLTHSKWVSYANLARTTQATPSALTTVKMSLSRTIYCGLLHLRNEKNNKNLKIMCEKVFLVFRHNQWCFHWPTCSVIFNSVWDEIHFLKDLHHLEWSSHGNWFEQKHPSLTKKTWKCFKRTIKRRSLRYMKHKAGKIVIMIIFKSPKSIWNELIS